MISKKSKKDRVKELRDDGFKKTTGADLSAVADRQIGDKRFERDRVEKTTTGIVEMKAPVTSTIDALQRMACGLEGRNIADRLADPNRPTWEQYKKDNADRLDGCGGEMKKMVEYRAELDRERERRLSQTSSRHKPADSSDTDSSEDQDSTHKKSSQKRKHKDKEKDRKKHKKEHKHKH